MQLENNFFNLSIFDLEDFQTFVCFHLPSHTGLPIDLLFIKKRVSNNY